MDKSVAALALAVLTTVGHAQSPAPAAAKFEVASVKSTRSGAPFRIGPVLKPVGRVVATNMTLRDIARSAFSIEENQLVGGPSGIDADRFDVEARGPADLTRPQA